MVFTLLLSLCTDLNQTMKNWTETKKKNPKPHQPSKAQKHQTKAQLLHFQEWHCQKESPSWGFWKHQLQFLISCIILPLVSHYSIKIRGKLPLWGLWDIPHCLTGRTGREFGQTLPGVQQHCPRRQPRAAVQVKGICYQDNSFCLQAVIISQPYLQLKNVVLCTSKI